MAFQALDNVKSTAGFSRIVFILARLGAFSEIFFLIVAFTESMRWRLRKIKFIGDHRLDEHQDHHLDPDLGLLIFPPGMTDRDYHKAENLGT